MKAVSKDVAIIGGGVAGLTCAKELSQLGLESVIVEKGTLLGGYVARYTCKATDTCQRCGACLLENLMDEVRSTDHVTSLVKASVTYAEKRDESFALKLVQQPVRIHTEQCSDCGECISACPVPGALVKSPLNNTISVDEEVCAYFKDGSCQACIEACGEGVIDLKASPEELEMEVTAVVLASGFKAFDPRDKPRFGFGRVPGVITSMELDSLIRNDNFDPGEGENRIQSVAFIQCVGSRDVKIDHNYCSRICCGQSLRLARVMRRRFDGMDPTMFYMDIQSFDRDFERRLNTIKREVRVIRAIPGEIRVGVNNRPELIYQGPGDANVIESFDLVVLSIGIAPDPSSRALGKLFGLITNEDGFLGYSGEQVSTNSQGVFVAGTIQGPKSIEETITHALRTAGSVASFIAGQETRDEILSVKSHELSQ